MTLYQEVEQQLRCQGGDDRTVGLALAALAGEEAVEALLAGEPVKAGGAAADGGGEGGGESSSVYLQDITVSGFRGIGPEVTLEIPSGPGLTVVAGRNGSGKSSFAEALEVLLTGDSLRWADKTRVWKEGWRNLHEGSATRIAARFQVEGKPGFTTVERTWSEGDGFNDAVTTAQHRGEARTDLSGVGWEQPLNLYQPLLSYNQLGRIVTDRPSVLFDKLTAVLGLKPLDDAAKVLSTVRKEREKIDKEVHADREKLIRDLAGLEDERAEKAVTALRDGGSALDSLPDFASKISPGQEALQALADLRPPGEKQVRKVASDLEDAHTKISSLAGTDTEAADRLIRLLEAALDHHRQHGDEPCPVCKAGTLDAGWRSLTEQQINHLRESADRYRAAHEQLRRATKVARSLVAVPSLPDSPVVNTADLMAAWDRWGQLPEDSAEILDHLLTVHGDVIREADAVSGQAKEQYSEREQKWAEVMPGLMAWLVRARESAQLRGVIEAVGQAEAALKKANESLRIARWLPIEAKALEIWQGLRLQSNVDLRSVELAGANTRRQVNLTMEVDGMEAPALAVASQGEFSCLALSLFFPRATLSESPFRFLVIDDPVQAMDPARVDGLARVFSEIASDRQLIVFTHDDRLPESLRRQGIVHTCIGVTRRPGSVVEVQNSLDPVLQYFKDAWAVANDKKLAEEVSRRVVPGFCRNGLEAACMEAVRRRRLGRGEAHAKVEQALEKALGLTQKASLALFDRNKKAKQVEKRIESWNLRFVDAFKGTNKGAHGKYTGDLEILIKDCEKLAERFRHCS